VIEILAVAMTLGAILFYFFHISFFVLIVTVICFVITFFFIFSTKRALLFSCIYGIVLISSALYIQYRSDQVYHPLPSIFQAKVLSVDRRLDSTVIIVRESEYLQNIQVSTVKTTVLPGDIVTVKGIAKIPQDFQTNTGRLFPYQTYLLSKDVVAQVTNAQVEYVQRGNFSFIRAATKARFAVARIFESHLSFPNGGIVSGMTIGYQGGIPRNIQDLFRTTGVLHVLVLSGYNITLCAGFLTLLCKSLPFHVRTSITFAAVILIVLVSGAGVASVRAGIMASIMLLSGISLQQYQPLRALMVTYCIFYVVSPIMIFVDPGFHLSFLATFAMLSFLPRALEVIERVSLNHQVKEILLLALGMPVYMLPYTMYFSGTVLLATILSNIVFALAAPMIMIGALILFTISSITPLTALLGVVMNMFVSFLIKLLEIFNRLPVWNTPPISGWCVVLIYSVITVLLFKNLIKQYVQQLRSSLQPSTNSFG
jgi:competence protein ComEC